MMQLGGMFSIYIDSIMLGIGLYIAFVQSSNLIQVDHLDREGRFLKIIGWFYIILGITGFILYFS